MVLIVNVKTATVPFKSVDFKKNQLNQSIVVVPIRRQCPRKYRFLFTLNCHYRVLSVISYFETMRRTSSDESRFLGARIIRV